MSGFLGSLHIVECYLDEWWLGQELPYKGATDRFVVPKGFYTDLASTPRILWWVFPPFGRYARAAVLHDWLYVSKQVSRKDADGIFRRAMRESGVGWITRRLFYSYVRAFGWIVWRKDRRT